MARPPISTERLVGHLGHVRSAHHHRNSRGPNRIRHAIRLGNHSGHGADADQSNIIVAHKLRDPRLVHRLRVAIHQQHFIASGSERLQQKHPQVRHEITGYTVVWVIEKNFHGFVFRDLAERGFAACLAEQCNGRRQSGEFTWRL